jgi:hypothetical protein
VIGLKEKAAMRATRLACLVILGFVVPATLLLAGDNGKKPHGPRGLRERISKYHGQDARQPAREQLSWDAEGFGATELQAKQEAINNGRETLMEYLASQGFSREWQPSNDFMQGMATWNPIKEQEDDDKAGVDLQVEGLKAQGWSVHFVLKSNDLDSLVAQEREYRSEQRMGMLGKGLAGLVALLAAVAGYFRLEEATKGYYTAWLRAGAIAFVGAAGAALLIIG